MLSWQVQHQPHCEGQQAGSIPVWQEGGRKGVMWGCFLRTMAFSQTCCTCPQPPCKPHVQTTACTPVLHVLLPCLRVLAGTTEASPPQAMTASRAGAVQREAQLPCCCSVLLSMPGASAATALPSPRPCSITAPPKAIWWAALPSPLPLSAPQSFNQNGCSTGPCPLCLRQLVCHWRSALSWQRCSLHNSENCFPPQCMLSWLVSTFASKGAQVLDWNACTALLQVESTARSWRAAGLLLMRQTVDQENRKAIVRGTICLIYLVRPEAWALLIFAAEPCHCSHCHHLHDAQPGTCPLQSSLRHSGDCVMPPDRLYSLRHLTVAAAPGHHLTVPPSLDRTTSQRMHHC